MAVVQWSRSSLVRRKRQRLRRVTAASAQAYPLRCTRIPRRVVMSRASTRSRIPPWPGTMPPESLTPVERLRSDSPRSPACPSTPATSASGTAWASGSDRAGTRATPSSAHDDAAQRGRRSRPRPSSWATRPRRACACRGSARRSRRPCRRTRRARAHSRTTPGPDVAAASRRMSGEQRERHRDEERAEAQRARAERRRLDVAEAHERDERARACGTTTSTVRSMRASSAAK